MPKNKDEGVLDSINTSRRSMIKGLPLFGTAVAASTIVPTGDVEAARTKKKASKKKVSKKKASKKKASKKKASGKKRSKKKA